MNTLKITPEFLRGYLKAIGDIEQYSTLWENDLYEECPVRLEPINIIKHLEFKEVRYRNDKTTKHD